MTHTQQEPSALADYLKEARAAWDANEVMTTDEACQWLNAYGEMLLLAAEKAALRHPTSDAASEDLREALAHAGLHGKLADAVLPIIEQERATAHREGMEAAAVIAETWGVGHPHIATAIRAQMETGK